MHPPLGRKFEQAHHQNFSNRAKLKYVYVHVQNRSTVFCRNSSLNSSTTTTNTTLKLGIAPVAIRKCPTPVIQAFFQKIPKKISAAEKIITKLIIRRVYLRPMRSDIVPKNRAPRKRPGPNAA